MTLVKTYTLNYQQYEMDFHRAEPTCFITNFPYSSSALQNGPFLFIVLRVMSLMYTQGLIQFSNCAGLSLLLCPAEHRYNLI